MEMSNDYIPELHVAQQRRRDKLRVQNFEDLQGQNNFHHLNDQMFPSEMLHFPTGTQSSRMSGHFSNMHQTQFAVGSSADTCGPHLQHGCEGWVPDGGNSNSNSNSNVVVDGGGDDCNVRPLLAVPQHILSHCGDVSQLPSGIPYQNTGVGVGVGVGVHGWGNNGGNDSELPLLPHALSLSLSSNQICEYQQHLSGGGGGGDGSGSGGGGSGGDPRELKPFEAGSICSIVKQSITSSGNLLECGNNNTSSSNNQVPEIGGSSIQVHRNVGPLGPFTGYAAILKSSKFLKPAQLLLDEFFAVAGIWRGGQDLEDGPSGSNSRSHGMIEGSMAIVPKIHGSNDLTGRSASCEGYRPDCHEKKAKLLHMQEEVCKRHKQYHQQMQMVISAFDSVPGLGNTTPYISRSVKTIMRHFRCLKNAITDQLQHIKRALGEDLSSPASFLKGDSSSSLRYDQNFVKVKSNSLGGPCHMGTQHHVWKPQRGLPERAVSILRAWLFDHFLHPYPTDNDKQMLATQTGLTRNQVSNWFINARVRLWKPMVEEIHMLETKTPSSELNSNDTVISVTAKNRQTAAGSNSGCKPTTNLGPCDPNNLEHLGPLTSLERPRGATNTEQLFQKCSRLETHQVPANMSSSSFIGFLPYQRQGLELGGIGAVSLTLGLRHGSETNHQQLQHQFLPQGMPFGGHVIHDFSS